MSEDYTKHISILSHEPDERIESMFPTRSGMIAKYSDIAIDKFKESFAELVNTLGDIVEALPTRRGDYDLDSLTFAVTVNGSGKVSLIGELSAGITSAITITLKKGGGTS